MSEAHTDMRAKIFTAGLILVASQAGAQSICSGTYYLNPQAIRGESSIALNGAGATLGDLLKTAGEQLLPVVSLKRLEDFAAAGKKATPPCAIYGNPVVGFSNGSDYNPTAVNHDSITPAVVAILGVHDKTDTTPLKLADLDAKAATDVMNILKGSVCHGMAAGVTTAIVYGSGVCGEVRDLVPSEGRGQSYLPTLAAYGWTATKPVALITRDSSGAKLTMKDKVVPDMAIHQARMVLVPVGKGTLGYGVYLHHSLRGSAIESRLQKTFFGLKPDKLQQTALDTDGNPDFREVNAQDREEMAKLLAPYLKQRLKK